MRDKLIPSHALALSKIVGPSVEGVELDHDTAIKYLQKKEIHITSSPGWKRVLYHGQPIGWVNVLSNRTNNYYPKELRILRESF
jgi:NOL1/NOP2/fmu family ribosome biogenesis protein